jgi:hypothetical protein
MPAAAGRPRQEAWPDRRDAEGLDLRARAEVAQGATQQNGARAGFDRRPIGGDEGLEHGVIEKVVRGLGHRHDGDCAVERQLDGRVGLRRSGVLDGGRRHFLSPCAPQSRYRRLKCWRCHAASWEGVCRRTGEPAMSDSANFRIRNCQSDGASCFRFVVRTALAAIARKAIKTRRIMPRVMLCGYSTSERIPSGPACRPPR